MMRRPASSSARYMPGRQGASSPFGFEATALLPLTKLIQFGTPSAVDFRQLGDPGVWNAILRPGGANAVEIAGFVIRDDDAAIGGNDDADRSSPAVSRLILPAAGE